jgi:hypothetical protein
VLAPDGTVPVGAQAGYTHRGETHLYYVGEDGWRTIPDVPLGAERAVAVAEGYGRVERVLALIAGIRDDVVLILPREATR